MPSPAAGKSDTPRTPTKLGRKPQQAAPKLGKKNVDEADTPSLPQKPSDETLREKAEDAPENVKDTKDQVEDTAKSTTGKVSQAGGDDDLEQVEPKPEDDEETAVQVEDDAEETADDATQKAGDEADTNENTEDDATDTASKAAESGKQAGEGALSGARGLAGRASNLAKKGAQDPAGEAKEAASDVQDTASEAAQKTQDTVGDAAEDAQETAGDATEEARETAEGTASDVKTSVEDTTGQQLPDLSILKGLEVNEEGIVNDKDGNAIGRLVEGDAEDLAGYEIGDDGEILDDDGDLVGRTELLPEAAKDQLQKAQKQPKLPDISILKGLTADKTGQILNEDGDFVGHLIEGDPSEIQGLEFNEKGEIVDEDGNVIARAELHPDAADLVDQDEEEDEDEEEGEQGEEGGLVGRAAEQAGEVAEGAQDTAEEAVEGIEDELPGVEALEGMQVNSEGEILNDEGEVVGQLAEGELDDVKGLTVNDKGEVVDSEGNVLGKVELAEGGAEKLKEAAQGALDIRILEGLKVNKKGKVLDEEGEEIGELKDGELKDCAGKTINDKGEVLDKEGNVIGKVEVVSGEAAFEALKALKERLGDAEGEVKEVEITPDLDILDGLKVNKKGQVLNEDGEPIGELAEGDIAECAGKKINEKGEVLDKDGNVIGKVRTLPQIVEQKVGEAEEAAEDAEQAAEDAEEAAEEAVGEKLPLDILEGLTVNKAGKLIDADGNIVGELVEGDAKKLSKSGITADAEGRFWDNKGNVIGRAETVVREDAEEEAPFAGLEGLLVTKGGWVEDENGNRVGQVVEGDAKKLVGRAVDEDGDIIDKKGSVVGHAERWEEPDEEPEPEAEAIDLSDLEGKTVNKQGNVIGEEGVPVARLVEGNPKELAGKQLDDQGQIWNDKGKVIGRVELIPPEERESKPEGPFAGLQGLRVVKDGYIADEDENIVGTVIEGNPKRLVGLAVDEDGDILDKYGNVKGHAEPIEEEEEIPDDLSVLDGLTLNKQGYLVNSDGIPVGRLVEGNLKDLAGLKSDGEGQIHNDTGKVVGRCELIPENERVTKQEGPFAGLEGLRVVKDGFVEDADGNRVGQITEGDPKKLVGNAVDEDGDIIDKYGNVKGHAEPWEEEEEAEIDLSALAGCTVNKAGNVVDSSGTILGRVAEGDPQTMVGKKVDGKGQIWDNAGNVIGRAELVQGASSGPEGPFAGFDNNSVAKDGTVQTPDGTIIGRVIEGDIQKLVGHTVDEDGDINDKNGNVIGKAERWEPEEKERRINPMAGMRVNKEGEVRDENGDVIGRLTAGDLGHCAGLEIDDNGYVIDNDGNKVGEVTLLENIQEEEEEPNEDAELANKMANICQQTLERIQPVCKQITEYIEAADRTPRDELDEEELVNNVKPLIEEGGRILQECNGSLRGLDPDGRIAAQAKGRAETREATPEEYRLADLLKEITTSVVTTIDNAKKKIADMPHAKKKLNPLWALLTEPLFQIIAAVGLLLTGVLNLVGRLLNGLGLGGLVNGLLGGLGIDKLLGGLGLGSLSDVLGGGKEKKKSGGGAKNLPIVGGLLGGK
ncbi:hypothetical protein BU24DRAFT_411160 [Aaosphaeria arxii CBS 175.79]|uniref:DUF6987 domain-containing protein n=1 Tax=Aaosphaeria arxii CBS 175.79 TaxID=1450172 RepID=A0A6A5XL13_9PLEO|nr:uncharacterized protein BU24DRAFT_411160 [Aaosphaeria arxii CBS 175.79]KAF2013420.1 hypothetical protein BU24DRAFT_411160 [Aaosphaeria arxii CBS 175.79]